MHMMTWLVLVGLTTEVLHPRPQNVSTMFRSQLDGLRKDLKPLVLMGVIALCWSLWLYRNAIIFENKQCSFLQVIYSITHWFRTWSILQKPTSQEVGCSGFSFFGAGDLGFFLPGHNMYDGLVYGLIVQVPQRCFFLFSFFRLCAFQAEADRISRCCITLV